MTQFATIRGYAIPFDRTMHIAGEGVEAVDRKAFDAMLAQTNLRVSIRWLSHDAGSQQVASNVRLFADDYGVGFSATIDVRSTRGRLSPNWAVLASMTRAANPTDQCSVGALEIAETTRDTICGIGCNRIVKAKFGHITICANAVYRDFTAVWRADVDLSAAPWRIQQMAARWDAGNAIAKEVSELKAKASHLIAQASNIVHGRGEDAGGDLSLAQVAAFNAKARAVESIHRQIAAVKARVGGAN